MKSAVNRAALDAPRLFFRFAQLLSREDHLQFGASTIRSEGLALKDDRKIGRIRIADQELRAAPTSLTALASVL